MKYRYSASFLKLLKTCMFRVFCKISEQPTEDLGMPPYGDAGTVVHNALEYYYTHLYDMDQKSALVELEQHFNLEWDETYKIDTPKLDKALYWLCVINAIKLNLKVTTAEAEYHYLINGKLPLISYIDAENSEANWLGDWKTATYKASKLIDFKEQLRFYAYMKWKLTRKIPMTWVYFNKVNKIFKYKWTEESLIQLENEIIEIDKDLQRRIKDMDFPRSPGRGNCFFCPYKTLCSTDLLREAKAPEYEIIFNLKKQKLLIEGSIPDILHRRIEKEINYLIKNSEFIILAMKKKGIHYDGIKRLYRRREYGGETSIGYLHLCHNILKEYAHSQGKKFSLTIKDFRNQDVLDHKIVTLEKLNIPFEFYDIQLEAVKALIKYRWGICEIGTGGGKTAIAAECIRQLKFRTLFVIDNKDLLMQTKDEYEKMLGIECGVVGMGKRDWDKPIVLSTIQTLAKHAKSFAGELSKFPFVIYDETHIVASKSFETISKYLTNTKYRFGFCLDPLTQILTPNKKVRLRSLKIGDEILSYNHKNKKVEIDRVSNIFKKEVEEFLIIRVQTEKGVKRIVCSNEHKFYTERGYIKAKDLKDTDEIYCENEDYIFTLMHKEYLNGKTLQEIAIKYGYNYKTIRRKFHSLNLKVRDYSECHLGIIPINKGSNPNRIPNRFPGFKPAKRAAIKRCTNSKGEVICEYCNRLIQDNDLHAHHNDRDRKNNIEKNISIVHEKCHIKIHSRNEFW